VAGHLRNLDRGAEVGAWNLCSHAGNTPAQILHENPETLGNADATAAICRAICGGRTKNDLPFWRAGTSCQMPTSELLGQIERSNHHGDQLSDCAIDDSVLDVWRPSSPWRRGSGDGARRLAVLYAPGISPSATFPILRLPLPRTGTELLIAQRQPHV